jgi:hypothetical protein
MNASTRARNLVRVAATGILLAMPLPAFAQVDLSGPWGARLHEDNLERGGGPEMNEFEGLPINAADRMRGDSWSASLWTVPEHQCIPHPSDYGPNSRNW